jgi:hypothetical protein
VKPNKIGTKCTICELAAYGVVNTESRIFQAFLTSLWHHSIWYNPHGYTLAELRTDHQLSERFAWQAKFMKVNATSGYFLISR